MEMISSDNEKNCSLIIFLTIRYNKSALEILARKERMNSMQEFSQWDGFEGRRWKEGVNVRDFIQNNYTPYEGDESFLEGATEATDKLWGRLQELQKEERKKGGVLDMETEVVSSLTAYGPGYIDEGLKDLEQVVGLQTDKPLKRAFMP